MNVLAINADGIRRNNKKLELEEILQEKHIDVRIASETDVRKEDMDRISFDGDAIVTDYSKQRPREPNKLEEAQPS